MPIKTTLSDQLKGNLNVKFGTKLPVPFIEGIRIQDESITVKAAVYLPLDHYSYKNFDEFRESLTGIKCYAMMAFDRQYTATSGSELTTENTLQKITTGKESVFSNINSNWRYVLSSGLTASTAYPNNSNIFSLGDIGIANGNWTEVETYFTPADKPVKKLITEIEIPTRTNWTGNPVAFKTSWVDPTSGATQSGFPNFLNMIKQASVVSYLRDSRDVINNVGFITFSTPLDVGPNQQEAAIIDKSFENNLASQYLYESLTSPLNSVVFIKNQTINESQEVIFITVDGEIVEQQDSLQALDAQYYYSDSFTLTKMISYFKSLTGTAPTEALQDYFDSLLTILETNDENNSLLLQLNNFLQSFVEKSSATEVGRFFIRLRDRVARVNGIIKSGNLVQKQLVTNPLIQDIRSLESSGMSTEVSTPSAIDASEYIYTNSVYATRYRTANLDTGTEEVIVTNGFVFFDYEKVLKKETLISQYFNVEKLENYFGNSLLTAYCYLDSATYTVYDYNESRTSESRSKIAYITLNFDPNDPNMPLETSGQGQGMNIWINNDYTEDWNTQVNTQAFGESNAFYLLRNFNLPVENAMNIINEKFYKLMCFQFNENAVLANSYDQNFPEFTFVLKDTTAMLMREFYNVCFNIKSELSSYYNLASESCSANQTDGFFNEFFINAMEAKYSDNPTAAPFYKAAFLYHFLRDLKNNDYNGDMSKIETATKRTINSISPAGGSLQILKDFLTAFENLMETVFTEDFVTVTDDRDNQELTIEMTAFDPDVLYRNGTSLVDMDDIGLDVAAGTSTYATAYVKADERSPSFWWHIQDAILSVDDLQDKRAREDIDELIKESVNNWISLVWDVIEDFVSEDDLVLIDTRANSSQATWDSLNYTIYQSLGSAIASMGDDTYLRYKGFYMSMQDLYKPDDD